jgi:hypothetical protein
MEMFDPNASDLQSVELFHEILTSGLNRENADIRWKMEWARSHMKTAIENLFISGELIPANNEESFESSVQRYVDVLNVMTDSVLTQNTYKEQFYIELEKGQLFRTLGKSAFARYVYQHLDDCQLDSLEQTALNSWLAEVDMELSLYEQYINEGLSPDSMSYEIETSGYSPAVEFDQSNYYFGMWILSPNLVNFMTCDGNLQFRNLKTAQRSRVYPNPTDGQFYVQSEGTGECTFELYDPQGTVVFSQRRISEAEPIAFDLRDALAAGVYTLVIQQGGQSQSCSLVLK